MCGFWSSNCSQTFKITCIDMKILPQWLEFKGKINQQILLKTNIWWKRYTPPKCGDQNAVWWTQIVLVNFNWISKNLWILDWSGNFTTQTRHTNKFYWIWTLDAKVTGLWIRLPDYVRLLLSPLGVEGLMSSFQWTLTKILATQFHSLSTWTAIVWSTP